MEDIDTDGFKGNIDIRKDLDEVGIREKEDEGEIVI